MIPLLIVIQFFTFILSLIEERIKDASKYIHIGLGIILIFIIGFREIGVDHDSEGYESYFRHYNDNNSNVEIEYSFKILANIASFIYDDVHALLLIYAAIAISVKFYSFKKISESLFLPIVVYMGFYLIMHELTQIRAGVVSSLILLSIIPLSEGKKRQAFLLLCLCVFFHYSALALFPVLLLNNKELTPQKRIIWGCVIPFSYAIHFFLSGGSSISIPIPYIGDKLDAYQTLRDKGFIGSEINVFNAILLVTILTYYYSLYFYDTIIKYNKYLPIILKLTCISVSVYVIFAFFPVISTRINALYGIATIILFTNIYYTIRPKWLGKCVVGVVGITLMLISIFFTKLIHP